MCLVNSMNQTYIRHTPTRIHLKFDNHSLAIFVSDALTGIEMEDETQTDKLSRGPKRR